MSFFDDYNKQRKNGTYQEPERNATWRDAEAAIRQTNPNLYNAVQQQRLVDQWNSYVYGQQRKAQEEMDAYTHGRGNRSYLREEMLSGSWRNQQAQEMAARRDTAGSRAWESFVGMLKYGLSVGQMAYMSPTERAEWEKQGKEYAEAFKQANKDAKATYEWAGRDDLIKEYKELQNKLQHQSQRSPENMKRFQEVKEELETKDAEYGNGKQPYSFADRSSAFFGGTVKDISGSLVSTGTTLADYIDRTRQTKKIMSDFLKNPEAGVETQAIRDAQNAAYRSDDQREKWDALYGTAKQLGEDAAADLDKAKGGLGFGGKALVDIGSNVIQMGFDAAVGSLTGGSALVPMAARVFGQGAQEARNAGATLNQQIGYGLSSAAIELATEKISDGVALIYGRGVADEVTEKLIGRLAKSDTGRSFLRLVAGGVGEGAEEVVSDLLSPLAESIYKEESIGELYKQLSLDEILYDYFIGAAIGTLGGAANYVNGTNTQKNAELRMIDEQRAQQQAARQAGYGGVSNQVDAAWDVLSGRVTPEQQQRRTAAAQETLGLSPRQAQAVEQYQNAPQEVREKAAARENDRELLTSAFSDAGIELNENEQETLTSLMQEGSGSTSEKITGMRDAYRLGAAGRTLEETELAMEDKSLSHMQLTRAWGFGASVQTAESGTADVSTEEGRTKVEAALSPLGRHVEAAVSLYEPRQDVGRYSAAMQKAAFLYAANGADVAKIAQDARAGKAADIVGILTDEQIKLAQQIGQEQRQKVREAEREADGSLTALRQKAAEIGKGQTVTAQALAETDKAIDVANRASQRAVNIINQTRERLEAMVKANPRAEQTEAYKNALDNADKQIKKIEGLQRTVRELKRRKAELEGKKTIQRKKGTVSYAGGTVDGVRYDGVDPAKLTRQQKKVTAMVETMADAVNLDYVFISAKPGMGGAYVKGGTVYVNINAGMGVGGFNQTMAAASLSHELTHWMQDYAPEQYRELKDFIVSEVLKADPQKLRQLVEQQRRWEKGRSLSYEQALDEVVANACQTMLLDSKAINKLARQNMSLAARIADFIEDWTNKIKEAFAEVDTSRGEIYDSLRAVEGSLDRIQELWDNGIEAAAQNYDAQQTARAAGGEASTEANENAAQNIGDVKNQFIGESAETADKDALALARQLDKQGVDNESIRQQTGWFRGMDGKWRYEIDDSGAKYSRRGDLNFRKENPSYNRFRELMEKADAFLLGDSKEWLTEAEQTELTSLQSEWGDYFREDGKPKANSMPRMRLSDYLQHDKLFKNYPRLANMILKWEKLPDGRRGEFSPYSNTITLNDTAEMRHAPLDTLAHEIQHAIQKIEDFTPGADTSYWLRNGEKVREKQAAKKIEGLKAQVQSLEKKLPDVMSQWTEEHDKISDEIDRIEDEIWRIENNKSFDARDYYWNTAGEIEARDVTARRQYDSDKRKAIPPNLGDENTVFAEGAQFQQWSDEEYDATVKSKDTEKAQQIVNAAAERAMPDSKIRTPDGKLRVVYHGTNSSGFTVFDSGYIGSASGDTGFFGRGFYFAYDSREARYYGKNVMNAFLNITNPFNFQAELNMLDGERTTDYNGGRAAFLINFAEKFPELVKGKTISVYDTEKGSIELSYTEFSKIFRDTMKNTKFEIEERDGEYGKEWLVKAGKHTESFTNRDGETFSWDEYDYQQTFTDERMAKDKVANAYEYLKSTKWSYINLPAQAEVIMDTDFSNELQKRGYDGVIQSEEGDEVVAFRPEQIKSADPVTYDDEGKVIPPSERFKADNQDIRYQRWDDTDGDTAAEANGREQSYARIEAEGKAVEDTIKALKTLTDKQAGTIAKLQKRLQLTKTPETRAADARKMARGLLQEYGSEAELVGISEQLKALGDYMLQTEAAKLDENEVRNRARSIAREIVENATEQVRMDDETLANIRQSIKGKKLTFDPAFLGELDQAGGFDAVRKRSFGTFTVARADSQSIDRSEYTSVSQFYSDLQSEYGKGYFPDLANEGEELLAIAENARAAAPMEINPFEQYMGEAVEHLSNQITMQIADGILRPEAPTDADRARSRREALNEQIKQLKREQKIADKDARELWQTVYDLSIALDKAQSRYKTLEVNGERRTQQLKAEGRARQEQIKARERERATEKIQALKEHYRDMQQRAKERRQESAGATRYRDQVIRKAGKLREMLLKNDDKTHVPEVLKEPLAAFFESLDFTSKRALRGGAETNADRAFAANLQKIQQILTNQQDYINGGDMKQDLGGYIDVSPDSMDFLRRTAELITTAMAENRDYTINSMSAAELKELSNFLSNLRTAINGMNQFMANARFESVREAASQDIQTIQELGRVSTAENGRLFHAAIWENGTPYYVFRRFGEGGRAIFDSFTRGWEKMAFNVQEVMNFTEKAYTDKEAREWQKQTHDITLEDGSEITMTTGQIMSLAMLLNREQAVKHLSKGGMRIGDIEGQKGTKTDTRHHHLTDADISAILGKLTERQMNVAKALQHFMAVKGSEWGNEISMRRFGYRFYTEGDAYFPIKTDSNDRPMSDTDAQQNSMFRLLNLSASKSLNPKASNALIVDDIFNVFADHMSDMAKLNGMGLPILDAIKWFNFKERIDLPEGGYDTRTMQGAMEEAFGKQALSYFRTLMKDINGVTESGDRGTDLLSRFMSNYKAAAVGANLRVAFLQPTSYVRASYLIKPQYLLQAFTNKNAYREATENSGTAVWKDLGYYDTNIARGMRDQIKHNEGLRDKIVEKSMALAGFFDKLTWGRLWVACKMQAAAETGKTGDELIQATTDLFREVIYSSQVMDSTLTRSELMRGKSLYTKALTAFMAEPTLSYNMVMDAAMEYNMNAKRYGKGEAWKRSRGYITKAATVYVCSAAFSAVVESIADAFRDDDDYESFLLKWSQAMFGEGNLLSGNLAQDLSLFGKLPYFKALMSSLQGYKNKDMSTAALDTVIEAYKVWKETIDLATGALDKPTKTTYYGNMTTWGKIYKTLQAISQGSGLALANMTRDVTAIWNSTVGAMYPDYKVRTYESSGDRKRREAIRELTGQGVPKDLAQRALQEPDADGNGNLKQDELGPWLNEKIESGELTGEQADAIWGTQGWKTSFDKWREKAK